MAKLSIESSDGKFMLALLHWLERQDVPPDSTLVTWHSDNENITGAKMTWDEIKASVQKRVSNSQ